MNWKNILRKLAGLGTEVTKEQRDYEHYKGETDAQKRTVESPQRAEFTGDKYPSGGKSVDKELAADKDRASTYKKLRNKGEVPVKVNNQKEFGSQLMTDKNSAENISDHEIIGDGAIPKYKVGWRSLQGLKKTANTYLRCPSCGYEDEKSVFTGKLGDMFGCDCPRCDKTFSVEEGYPVNTDKHPKQLSKGEFADKYWAGKSKEYTMRDKPVDPRRTNLSKVRPGIQDQFMGHSSVAPQFYVGAKFASVRTKNCVTIETMSSFGKLKEKIATGEYKYIDPTNSSSIAPKDDNSIVVAYSRDNDTQKYTTLLGNFVQSFKHLSHEQPGKIEIASARENAINEHNDRSEGLYCDVYYLNHSGSFTVEEGNERGHITEKSFDNLDDAMSEFGDSIFKYNLNIAKDESEKFRKEQSELDHYDYTNAENEDREQHLDTHNAPLSSPEHFAKKADMLNERNEPKLICHCGKEVPLSYIGGQYQFSQVGKCAQCGAEYLVEETNADDDYEEENYAEGSRIGWRKLSEIEKESGVEFVKKPDGQISISVEEDQALPPMQVNDQNIQAQPTTNNTTNATVAPKPQETK